MGFCLHGATALHISNSNDPNPQNWNYRQTHLPNTYNGLNFGVAATQYQGYVYLIGNFENSKTVLARAAIEDIQNDNYDNLMYWSDFLGFYTWWVYQSTDVLANLFSPAQSEATIQFHPLLNQWYMLVLEPFKTSVGIIFADDITGPWGNLQEIYNIPAPWNSPSIFCYAVKSHPEFAQPNEILFTFMSNGKWEDLTNETYIYIPQMIRVTITG